MKLQICALLVIFLASCGSAEHNKFADQNAAEQTATGAKQAVDVGEPAEAEAAVASGAAVEGPKDMPEETPIGALVGTWTVTGVWAGGDVAAFAKDDAAIMGSTVVITADSLSWGKKASRAFESGDTCEQPIPKLMLTDPSSEAGFDGALKQFGITRSQTGNWHEWLCGKAGEWGPSAAGGSTFFPVGKDRLMMSWYDGVILLLKRGAS
jgi:hypothetical protein